MGGRGAYWEKLGKSAKENHKPKKGKESDGIIFNNDQLGKKIGKHAKDFGLDPQNETDRAKFFEITKSIIDGHEEKRTGRWRGQKGPVTFYAKGNDVVVVNSKNEYVTTLKDGVTNKKYKEAKKK